MTRLAHRALMALALLTLSVAARESVAETVPYHAIGIGAYSPINGDYSGSGIGTPIGAHTFYGNVAVWPTSNPLVFQFASTVDQETVDCNGDTITFSSSGQVQLIPLNKTNTIFSAIWTGQFVVTGGTGRFANAQPAAKPLSVIAINDPFMLTDPVWNFFWTLDGSIRLP